MVNVRQDELSTRACRCLNIRIQFSPPPETPPDFLKDSAADSTYTLTYVDRDGLSVAHPQMTMRTRKMGSPLGGTNRCVRYTTLTCLLCQTLAYRVQQLVPLDVEGQEGPLLPTHDWVEQDILMSSSGWIEVHSNCLDPDAVSRLMASTTYSPIFNVDVPSAPAPSTQTSYIASTDAPHPEITPQPVLSNLRPVFPPAPFIPSHPVFSHLSSIAMSKSQALRMSAEEQLTAIIRDRVAEIEKAEDELKRVVESLWRRFLESLSQTEKEWGISDATKRRDSAKKLSINTTTQVVGTPLVSIRDFVPVPSPTVRVASPASIPRVSSLSASLATSAFHHPRVLREGSPGVGQARDTPRSPPPYSSHPSSVGSADSRSLSSSTSSGELLALANADSLSQPFKRSMDETRDTSASFRYFIDMEAEMEMMRGRQKLSAFGAASEIKEATRNATEGAQASNTSGSTNKALEPKEAKGDRLQKSGHDKSGRESRAKRKVTFDIKPDTLTTDGPTAKKVGNGQGRDAQDMIFDLEGESSDRDSSDAAPVLPFKEVPYIPRRHVRPRGVTIYGGLPASLSSLRPTSLPAYASLQAQITDEESSCRTHPPPPEQLDTESDSRTTGLEYPEALDPQEEEILKLVAADTPSHRGAWRPNSKAWQLFVSRQGGKNDFSRTHIPEESEVGDTISDTDESDEVTENTRYNPPGIPASLPISIEPLSRKLEPLSLGSYQPKTPLSDHPGAVVPLSPRMGDRRPASALRKASYAARDRDRSMDPGTLDFVLQENQDDESDDELSQVDPLDEARGRRRALKILEVRNRLPAAGMWRSLA